MATSLTSRFCGGELSLEIPGGWEIAAEVKPRPAAGLADPGGALRSALAKPIGCTPLSREDVYGKKIVLAVDDITRPAPLHRYFGDLVGWLAASGARREDLLVLNALGIHRPMTQAEVEGKLGKDAVEGVRWENHDCKNMSKLAEIGRTSRGTDVILNKRLAEADIILCVGAIEPHPLLGFGGGSKMILPGLAHEETIAQNHMQGVSPGMYNYIGVHESPMRLDIEEAAGMLKKRIFIVNALMNDRLEICRFVCGDPVAAHREGVKAVEEMNGSRVAEKADVAITFSNPMNADLRQGMKSIANVEPCVKEGGTVVAFLECKNGVGDVAVPPKSLPHGVLRTVLRVLGRDRLLWFVDKVKKGAGVEERFLAHFSLQVARKIEIFIHSPNLPPDLGKRMGVFRQFPDPQAMIAAAAARAPRNARVLLFPHGGVTYPILPGVATRTSPCYSATPLCIA
ncbi:MAG: nickel-dependent lactate racemase [Deltaproteobacteria bacterium]|nr:nickel-dependent lactate racemase [Deltaproteobacteria bacterium]